MRSHRHLAAADHHEPANTGVEDRKQRCSPERRATRQRRRRCPFGVHGIGRDDIEMDGYPRPAPKWITTLGSTENPHQIRLAHSHIVTLMGPHTGHSPRSSRPGVRVAERADARLVTSTHPDGRTSPYPGSATSTSSHKARQSTVMRSFRPVDPLRTGNSTLRQELSQAE
jgi:hypothetical protein